MTRTSAGLALFSLCAFGFTQGNLDVYPVFENDKTPPAELKARREQIKQTLGVGTVGVFFTNPERNRNNDVDFLFRGDSNFLYLTGFEEPDSALILAPDGIAVDGKKTTEVLFVNEPSLGSITWLGYRMGPANAVKLLGIETALPNKRFKEVLSAAVGTGVKLSINTVPDATGSIATMIADANALKTDANAGPNTVRRQLATMRGVKSPFEVALLKKACDVSARGHIEAMKAIRPNMREYEIAALQRFVFDKNGCEYTGYPNICGSGPNSTILHYESNRRQMKDGEIFCTDSAGEFHGYSADVTRSYPVNGKFSPEQRAIYEIVYEGQETGINMCKSGASFGAISDAVSAKLADGLIKLGVIKNASELGKYYMHDLGHGIGLDVHDPMPGTLAPGVCLTIEPGIYIKEGSPCDKKWWNIGIRIEDDVLVTDGAPVNMSAAAPRKWQDIERLMAGK